MQEKKYCRGNIGRDWLTEGNSIVVTWTGTVLQRKTVNNVVVIWAGTGLQRKRVSW